MMIFYFIGLDIHRKMIAFCIKALDGRFIEQGTIDAIRKSLVEWVNGLPGPWIGVMETTIFTGCIYDFLRPFAVELKVAHPEMLKEITAAQKKNDRADTEPSSSIQPYQVALLFRFSRLQSKDRSVSSRSCR